MASSKYLIDIQTKGAKQSEKQIKGVNASLGGLAKKAGAAAAAYFGTQALLAGIKSSVELFAKQEEAEKKLRFAAGDMTNALLKQASALQEVTRFGDEAIIAQQAYLASLGFSQDQIEDTISASVDLAAATGMTLESAVMNTAKTLSGMAGELGEKLSPAFRALTPEALKAGEGIKFIADQFAGTAQADATSLAGTLDQMRNALGDAGEAVGEVLAPAIIVLANVVKNAAESFQSLVFWQDELESRINAQVTIVDEATAKYKDYTDAVSGFTKTQILQELAEFGVQLDGTAESTQNALNEFRNLTLELENNKQNYDGITMSLSEMMTPFDEMPIQFQQVNEQTSNWNNSILLLLELLAQMPDSMETTKESFDSYLAAQEESAKAQEKENELMQKHSELTVQQLKDRNLMALARKKEAENKLEEEKADKKTTDSILKMIGKKDDMIAESFITGKGIKIKEAAADAAAMASRAYKALAGIPIVGPALGAAAGAAAFAFGMKQVGIIKSFAKGGSFITNGAELILVGDNPSGREQVDVTPLGVNEEASGSGQNIVLNISNPIMTDTFVEESIIPSIREGLRLGESLD